MWPPDLERVTLALGRYQSTGQQQEDQGEGYCTSPAGEEGSFYQLGVVAVVGLNVKKMAPSLHPYIIPPHPLEQAQATSSSSPLGRAHHCPPHPQGLTPGRPLFPDPLAML